MFSLSDYSGAKLDKLYKDNDDLFPEEKVLVQQFDRCFSLIADLPKSTITDTIFSRQPIFFSLLVVLNQYSKLPSQKKLISIMLEIDARFNSDKDISQRPAKDVKFFEACKASTQRISSRRVRHNYIKSFID